MIYFKTTNLSCFLYIIKKGVLLMLLKNENPVLWKFITNVNAHAYCINKNSLLIQTEFKMFHLNWPDLPSGNLRRE